MLVKQEQVSPCEVHLEIEIAADKVKSALDDTYIELGKSANIPGFRKGKAPRAILEQFLDTEKVKDRAVDKLVKKAYPEALEESKIEPFAPADAEMVKMEVGEPMVFKAKVPLPPVVELGEYVGLEIERKLPPVEDEHVQHEIDQMLDRRAEYTQITDRPVKEGDVILFEMKNDQKPDEEPKRNVAEIGKNLPDFDKGVVGMNVDEEKIIEVSYPEDYHEEELKGNTVPIRTKVIEINEKHLPELTDEWVKANFVGEQEEGAEPDPDAVDSKDKLYAKMREALDKSAHDIAEEDVRNEIIQQVVANSKVCIPEVMIEDGVAERMERMQADLKKRKATIDDYLAHTGQSYEELYKIFAEESKKVIETTLVFREIMDKENIKVEDEDVEAEISAMASQQGVPAETIKAYMDKTDGGDMIKNRVLRKKIVDFLVHASNIKNIDVKG